MITYFSNSVHHWQVSQAHRPEQVEHLGDVGVGRHRVGARVHVGGDILETHKFLFYCFSTLNTKIEEYFLNRSYHYHAGVEQGEVQVMDIRVTWVIFSHLCIGQPGLSGALNISKESVTKMIPKTPHCWH